MSKRRITHGDVEASRVWQAPHLRNYPEGGPLQGSELMHRLGVLPRLSLYELGLDTSPELHPQTLEAERALQAISEGCVGSLAIEARNDEPFSPPTNTPWGRESPAELGCELGDSWASRNNGKQGRSD